MKNFLILPVLLFFTVLAIAAYDPPQPVNTVTGGGSGFWNVETNITATTEDDTPLLVFTYPVPIDTVALIEVRAFGSPYNGDAAGEAFYLRKIAIGVNPAGITLRGGGLVGEIIPDILEVDLILDTDFGVEGITVSVKGHQDRTINWRVEIKISQTEIPLVPAP